MKKIVKHLYLLEEKRQQETLQMIPSENHASKAVRECCASFFMNKYSEGYPFKRYYQGNKYVDELESLVIEKIKKIFKVEHANVQPYSGSPANSAVLFGLLNYGDKIMGLKLSAGGHLTHGHSNITFSGRFFKSVQFDVNERGFIDYDEVERLALKEKPKLLIIGTTSYPMKLDWERFGKIADKIKAYFVADIAHVAGLVTGGVYPSPVPFCHIVTTTTHKTLRGPRGAIIMITKKGLEKDKELKEKIDRAVFPGLQGGPHNNTTLAILQCLCEAETKEFKKYAKQVVKNSKVLAQEFKKAGLKLVCNGTESHLIVIDLKPLNVLGNVAAIALERAGIIVNSNSVPHDPMPPFYPSGIRLGTPALTTRGMKEKEMKIIAGYIVEVLEAIKHMQTPTKKEEIKNYLSKYKKEIEKNKKLLEIAKKVKKLALKFPIK